MISSKKHEVVALTWRTKSSPAPPRYTKMSYFMAVRYLPFYLAVMDDSLSVHLQVNIWKVAKQTKLSRLWVCLFNVL